MTISKNTDHVRRQFLIVSYILFFPKTRKVQAQTSQCNWSSMTLYSNRDPLVMLAGIAKKQPSKLGENAQIPKNFNFQRTLSQQVFTHASESRHNLLRM